MGYQSKDKTHYSDDQKISYYLKRLDDEKLPRSQRIHAEAPLKLKTLMSSLSISSSLTN